MNLQTDSAFGIENGKKALCRPVNYCAWVSIPSHGFGPVYSAGHYAKANETKVAVGDFGRELHSRRKLIYYTVQHGGKFTDHPKTRGVKCDASVLQLAKALKNVVGRHMTDITRYQPLLGSIDHLRRNAPLPNSGASDLYHVELLDIGIY